jgi:transposase
MPRPSYPPPDFTCPYEHNCPYLDWLSTTWVLGEYRRAGETYQEHLRIIDTMGDELNTALKRIQALEKENAELKAKNTALHRRQFKANKKKDTDENGRDAENASTPVDGGKKRRGAPVGHSGWFRHKPIHVDQTVEVPAPRICPHCQSHNLTPIKGVKEHLQEDIVLQPRPFVTRYLHREAFCGHCNRPVVQAAEDELLNAPIGPVAKSAAIYLRYRIGMTYRKVQEVFRDLFGLQFVPASAVGFDRQAAVKGAAIYEDLREKIKASAVIHADETSWRNDGIGHFAWYAGNTDLAFFQIDRHRSTEVAQSILGSDFGGVLVADRYAAYNGANAKARQSCLGHLMTKAKEITRELLLIEDAARDKKAEAFCDKIATFFSEACAVGQELLSGTLQWNQASLIEKQFVSDLKKLCACKLSYNPAETLRASLIGKDQKHLFTFLRHPGVQPTNNQAEQSIRFLVIFRKIMFGTRSESGLRTHSILPSLLLTAMRQGRHPREFLQTLLTCDTAKAQAALYCNSS